MSKHLLLKLTAAAIAISALAANISADSIAEPGDAFLQENRSECEYINWRNYTVTEDTDIYLIPMESDSIDSLEQGEIIEASFKYTDSSGNVWACCTLPRAVDLPPDERYGYIENGWVRMDKLEVVYDIFSFAEEHESEIREYDGEIDWYTPENDVILWDYPFSENYRTIAAEEWYNAALYPWSGGLADNCWTDENGNTWVYFRRCSYAKGREDYCWVFQPDPETTDIAALNHAYGDVEYLALENIPMTESAAPSENFAVSYADNEIDEETSEAYEKAVQAVEAVKMREQKNGVILPVVLAMSTALISAVIIKIVRKN